MTDGLKNKYRKAIIDIISACPRVKRAVLFGSRAMGTFSSTSDVDIALFSEKMTLTDLAHLSDGMEELSMPQTVDLLLYRTIKNKKLLKHIEEHGVQWWPEVKDKRKSVIGEIQRVKDTLPDGWVETTLGDVIITNDATYSKKDKWMFTNYLDTGNLTENQIADVQHLVIGEDKIPSRAKRKVQPGDIVYSTVRPNQKHYGILKNLLENLLVSTGFVTIRAKKEEADTNFIYWFLVQPEIIERLQTIGEHSTSAYPSIKPSDIEELKLNLPPLPEQQAIAYILGSLDDKIELNRRMNETLEAMAQALFKSWFVDFDPVIDNAIAAGKPISEELKEKAEIRRALGDTRKPLPKEIQKLFPSEFEHTEKMGWIPKEWRVSTVGEEFNVTMRQFPPGSTYNETGEGIPFFQGRADFGFRYPSKRVYCTAPKRFAEQNDTLVSVRAPVGDVNMAFDRCCIGRGVGSVRHKSSSRSYTYYSMLQLREYFNTFEAEGTVFGSISQNDFKSLKWISSDNALIKKYERLAGQFDEKIEVCSKNIVVLTKLRYTLLPKLLSGDIRVPEVEKLMEGAE